MDHLVQIIKHHNMIVISVYLVQVFYIANHVGHK